MTADTAAVTDPRGRTANPWVVTWTVLLGAFAVGINFTILAVSRPAIAADLGVDPSTLVWLISGPILANALTTATAGKLGDLYGHRRVYLVGILGSAVFAAASALAWDAWSLVAFRILGAIVGAAAGPASMATINLMFPPAQRSKALGYWSMVGAGGPVVGLVIGGPLVDAFGWRTIFEVQVPLLVLAAIAAWRLLPESPRAPRADFDVAGNVAIGFALLALLIGVERGRVWGWTSPATVGCAALSVAAGLVFIRVEQRAADPLIPIAYFRRRSFAVPIIVLFFAQFGHMGGFILAPKLLAEVGGVSATHISTLLIPRPLTFGIAGVASGYFVRRVGIRRLGVTGTAFTVISLVMISMVTEHLNTWVVVASIALSGLGMGLAQPAISTSIANSVADGDLGAAGATNQMVAQVATSLGMNLIDSVQAGLVATAGLAGSYAVAYRLGAGITFAGVVAAFMLPRRSGATR